MTATMPEEAVLAWSAGRSRSYDGSVFDHESTIYRDVVVDRVHELLVVPVS